MAFRASNVLPADAYLTVKRAAVQLKINLQSFNTFMDANNTDYDYLHGIYRTLVRARDQLNALSVTPGLAEYAQIQEDDNTYDVAAEFVLLLAAIDSGLTWMNINIPTNVTVKDPATWDDSTMILDNFTPIQTAGLRTELTAIVAEVI